jgi:hypothetical protein
VRIEDILATAPTDTIIIKADIEGFECKVGTRYRIVIQADT